MSAPFKSADSIINDYIYGRGELPSIEVLNEIWGPTLNAYYLQYILPREPGNSEKRHRYDIINTFFEHNRSLITTSDAERDRNLDQYKNNSQPLEYAPSWAKPVRNTSLAPRNEEERLRAIAESQVAWDLERAQRARDRDLRQEREAREA
jgi:hypothetical protein